MWTCLCARGLSWGVLQGLVCLQLDQHSHEHAVQTEEYRGGCGWMRITIPDGMRACMMSMGDWASNSSKVVPPFSGRGVVILYVSMNVENNTRLTIDDLIVSVLSRFR